MAGCELSPQPACCLTVTDFLYLSAAAWVAVALLPRRERNVSLLACPADTSLLGVLVLGEAVESILCLGEQPGKIEIVFVCHRHLTRQCPNTFFNFEWTCLPPSGMLGGIHY